MNRKMMDVYMGIKSDSIPIGIYSRYLQRGASERAVRNAGVGIIDYFPSVSLLAPPWHLLPGFLSEVKNTDFTNKYVWKKKILRQIRSYTTPVGDLTQEIETDPAGAGSEHIIKHFIATTEDYKIMQYIVENTVFQDNDDAFKQRLLNMGEDGVVLNRLDRTGYQKLLIELVGPEQFFLDLYDKTSIVGELIQAIDRRGDEQFARVIEQGHSLIWQPDNITSDMTPPEYFNKYILPVYEKRNRSLSSDQRYIIHMDGRLAALAAHLQICRNLIIESFSLPEIGGDLPLEMAGKALSNHRVFINFPSNWSTLKQDELENKCRLLAKQIEDLDYPLMLQISEDLPEKSYFRVLEMLVKVFN